MEKDSKRDKTLSPEDEKLMKSAKKIMDRRYGKPKGQDEKKE